VFTLSKIAARSREAYITKSLLVGKIEAMPKQARVMLIVALI
jgi:hypothetical protein